MSKFILILLAIISATFAYVNGPCTGRDGICIDTSKCSSAGGTSYSGKCPSDANSIKCCDSIPCTADDGRSGTCTFSSKCSGETVSGKCPGGSDFKCCLGGSSGGGSSGGSTSGFYFGPCKSGGGACINTDSVTCDTHTVSGKCSGANNIKCCVAGDRPSWYINQGDYRETITYINGEAKSVASSGCGMASLSMGIGSVAGTKISPVTLFKEANNKGYYNGNGFSHGAISDIGKNHGVTVSWTSNIDSVFSALQSGKGVIFHVGSESTYHFTSGGHYIFLKGAKTQNGIQKVYVFDPNGRNNYVNVLFALKKSDNGIQKAQKGTGSDFGIVSKS